MMAKWEMGERDFRKHISKSVTLEKTTIINASSGWFFCVGFVENCLFYLNSLSFQKIFVYLWRFYLLSLTFYFIANLFCNELKKKIELEILWCWFPGGAGETCVVYNQGRTVNYYQYSSLYLNKRYLLN